MTEITVGTKLISLTSDWYDTSTLEASTIGPNFDEVVTIRKFIIEYDELSQCFGVMIWLEEYPGDTDEDAYWLTADNFSVYTPEES